MAILLQLKFYLNKFKKFKIYINYSRNLIIYAFYYLPAPFINQCIQAFYYLPAPLLFTCSFHQSINHKPSPLSRYAIVFENSKSL